MRIRFKLYALLSDYLPSGALANQLEIEVPEGITPEEVARTYKVPRKLIHTILVNGVYIDPDQHDKYLLTEGDVLAMWPLVG